MQRNQQKLQIQTVASPTCHPAKILHSVLVEVNGCSIKVVSHPLSLELGRSWLYIMNRIKSEETLMEVLSDTKLWTKYICISLLHYEKSDCGALYINAFIICDRICEKEPSTHIRFHDLGDHNLVVKRHAKHFLQPLSCVGTYFLLTEFQVKSVQQSEVMDCQSR